MKQKILILMLMSVVAFFCGSGWTLAQQLPATEIAGGPGGSPFSDMEPGQGARVVEVQVRSGNNVDSVQFVYSLSDGRTVMGPQHGGPGGRLNVFHLDADEFLVGVSGRSGAYIDSIRFETNKRTSPTFGGNGGNRDFRVGIPPNAQVVGFTGRAGNYLDAIGLTFVQIRRGPVFSFRRGPQPGQTSIAGGAGGTEFVDANIPAGAEIIEVRVGAGNFIDSIQLVYSLPNGRPVETAVHGGGGGRPTSFRLQRGEYIIGLSGRCGTYVDSLRIHTNRRTSPLFGGSGGDNDYRIDVPDGAQATGFLGSSGMYLDAVGLTYARMSGPQRDRGRRRDR